MRTSVAVFVVLVSIVTILSTSSSQSCFPVTVYNATTGSLDNGFQNWSWASINLQSTSTVYPGSKYSLSMVVNSYQALYIYGSFVFSISELTSLTFRVNGGSQGNQLIRIGTLYNGTQMGTWINLQSYIPNGNIPANTWVSVTIPFLDFQVTNPKQLIYGMQFQASTSNNMGTAYFDSISFCGTPSPPSPVSITISPSTIITNSVSPYIFGVNFANSSNFAQVRYPVNRWGGDATTRYAWQLDASNHANDWFFENIANNVSNINELPNNTSSDTFINQTITSGSLPVLTLGTIGWSPIDRQRRCGFAISKYGPQQSVDPYYGQCGNGVKPNGQDITGNDPSDTSVQVGPDYAVGWIKHINQIFGSKSVLHFQLDNEPGLWSSMHRDVHPNPLGYDDYINYTIAYSTAVKQQFPWAVVHGPICWGWCEIEYSPKDGGCVDGADRKAHGDLPLVQYYLSQVSEYLEKMGVRIVDVLDVHFYPQQPNVDSGSYQDPYTTILRFRSVKSLYDPNYIDETWIGVPIQLFPRLRGYITYGNLKGLPIALSEYNFGGDNLITGALVQLDLFGVFAQQGVQIASRWVVPAIGSYVEQAFKLVLNYDGQGSSILPSSLVDSQSSDSDQVSVYTFLGKQKMFVVFVCKQGGGPVPVSVEVEGGVSGGGSLYQFTGSNSLRMIGSVNVVNGVFAFTAPEWSATLAVLNLSANVFIST